MKLFALFLCLSSAITTVQSMESSGRYGSSSQNGNNRMQVEDNSGVRGLVGHRVDAQERMWNSQGEQIDGRGNVFRRGRWQVENESVMEQERTRHCVDSMQHLYEYAANRQINYSPLFTDRFLQKLRSLKANPAEYSKHTRNICDAQGKVQRTRNYIDDAIFAITGDTGGNTNYTLSFQPFSSIPNTFGYNVHVNGREFSPEIGQVLGLVYYFVENPTQCENAEPRAGANLLYNLIRNVGSCVEDDGHLVCNTGKSQRVLSTLQGYIANIAITADVDVSTGELDNPPESFVLEVQNIITRHAATLREGHPVRKFIIEQTLHRNANKESVRRYLAQIIEAWKDEARVVYGQNLRAFRAATDGLSKIYDDYSEQLRTARSDNELTEKGLNLILFETIAEAKPRHGNDTADTTPKTTMEEKIAILLDGAQSTHNAIYQAQAKYSPKLPQAKEKFLKSIMPALFAQRAAWGDTLDAEIFIQMYGIPTEDVDGVRREFSTYQEGFQTYLNVLRQQLSRNETTMENENDAKRRIFERAREDYTFLKELIDVFGWFSPSSKVTYDWALELTQQKNIPSELMNRVLTRLQQQAQYTYAMIHASKMDYDEQLRKIRIDYIPHHEEAQKLSLVAELSKLSQPVYEERLSILQRDARMKRSPEAASRVTKFEEAWRLSRTYLADLNSLQGKARKQKEENWETALNNVVRAAIREQEKILACQTVVNMLNEFLDLSKASFESITDFCKEQGKLASDLDTGEES